MSPRHFLAATAVSLGLIALSPAHAGMVWSYNYSGAGASGSGYLATTSTLSGGTYDITGISGKVGSAPILSLLAAGNYPTSAGGLLLSDNLLHASGPLLGYGGFTVQTASDLFNVYYTGGQYYQLAGADCAAATCGSAGHLGTGISFSATLVPSIDWAFTYSGAGIHASGVLTTLATPVAGHYQIVGLSGERDLQDMNALLPAGNYATSAGGLLLSDNLLADAEPFLEYGGFTFHSGTDLYNVYRTNQQYYELAGADCAAATCGSAGHLGTPIGFNVSRIPEPNSLALLIVALLAATGLRGRKSTASQRAA